MINRINIKPLDLLSDVKISTVVLCLSIAASIVVTCNVPSTVPKISDHKISLYVYTKL